MQENIKKRLSLFGQPCLGGLISDQVGLYRALGEGLYWAKPRAYIEPKLCKLGNFDPIQVHGSEFSYKPPR